MTRRMVLRRTRLTDTAQQRLWPDCRHHALLTDINGDVVSVDAFHRHHAVVELAIRDPLIRWTAILGDVLVEGELTVARTIRTRLIGLPGRLVNRAGRPTLRLPDRWPWADTLTTALDTLRLLRPAPT